MEKTSEWPKSVLRVRPYRLSPDLSTIGGITSVLRSYSEDKEYQFLAWVLDHAFSPDTKCRVGNVVKFIRELFPDSVHYVHLLGEALEKERGSYLSQDMWPFSKKGWSATYWVGSDYYFLSQPDSRKEVYVVDTNATESNLLKRIPEFMANDAISSLELAHRRSVNRNYTHPWYELYPMKDSETKWVYKYHRN